MSSRTPGVRVPQVEYHWSKAWVFGRSLAGIMGLNLPGTDYIDVLRRIN
jgi:hypothetical protein